MDKNNFIRIDNVIVNLNNVLCIEYSPTIKMLTIYYANNDFSTRIDRIEASHYESISKTMGL